MADVNQYALPLRELIELIIKANNVHEGQWSLLLGFQIATGMFGPTPEQAFPGAAISVNQIGIQRHPPGVPTTGPGVIVVDAEKVNPKSQQSRRRSADKPKPANISGR
jgi:hypothetical protein